jgi:uncharacterized membrane protein YgaE (UPF0421/DUF939 family)
MVVPTSGGDVGAVDQVRGAGARLRRDWRFVVEATVAATIAWFISARVLDHPQPFFAPAAALLVLGAARGQRRWRAAEVVIGVAVGVLVADIVAILLGPGTALTVCVVIALTATAAVAFGASTVLLVQAMVSAVYVAIVAPPTHSFIPTRFVDALVGGGVALVITTIVGPRDPLRPASTSANAVLAELSDIVTQLVAALRGHDVELARDALARARTADALVDRLVDAAEGARESLWFAAHSRSRVRALDRISSAATQCDYLVRNVRVLARSSVVLVRDGSPVPQSLLDALEALAAAMRLAGESYAEEALLDDARSTAVRAVSLASDAVPHDVELQQVTIVAQVRAAAIDLLRATGVTDRASIDVVDDALSG